MTDESIDLPAALGRLNEVWDLLEPDTHRRIRSLRFAGMDEPTMFASSEDELAIQADLDAAFEALTAFVSHPTAHPRRGLLKALPEDGWDRVAVLGTVDPAWAIDVIDHFHKVPGKGPNVDFYFMKKKAIDVRFPGDMVETMTKRRDSAIKAIHDRRRQSETGKPEKRLTCTVRTYVGAEVDLPVIALLRRDEIRFAAWWPTQTEMPSNVFDRWEAAIPLCSFEGFDPGTTEGARSPLFGLYSYINRAMREDTKEFFVHDLRADRIEGMSYPEKLPSFDDAKQSGVLDRVPLEFVQFRGDSPDPDQPGQPIALLLMHGKLANGKRSRGLKKRAYLQLRHTHREDAFEGKEAQEDALATIDRSELRKPDAGDGATGDGDAGHLPRPNATDADGKLALISVRIEEHHVIETFEALEEEPRRSSATEWQRSAEPPGERERDRINHAINRLARKLSGGRDDDLALLPLESFRQALVREVYATLGLDIEAERLEFVSLPKEAEAFVSHDGERRYPVLFSFKLGPGGSGRRGEDVLHEIDKIHPEADLQGYTMDELVAMDSTMFAGFLSHLHTQGLLKQVLGGIVDRP